MQARASAASSFSSILFWGRWSSASIENCTSSTFWPKPTYCKRTRRICACPPATSPSTIANRAGAAKIRPTALWKSRGRRPVKRPSAARAHRARLGLRIWKGFRKRKERTSRIMRVCVRVVAGPTAPRSIEVIRNRFRKVVVEVLQGTIRMIPLNKISEKTKTMMKKCLISRSCNRR